MTPLNRALSIRRQCAWRSGANGGVGTLTGTSTRTGTAASIASTLWLRRGLSSSAVQRQGKNMVQSQSPLGKIGVEAALAAGPGGAPVKPTLWDEFALRDRVALVSGANRGLGLEMALALVEAGARAVYCVDLPERPGEEWRKVAEYVRRMGAAGGGGDSGAGKVAVTGRLEYVCADVRDQKAMWRVGEEIGGREGRMDVCVAAAGILKSHTDCLEYPAEQFEQVRGARPDCVVMLIFGCIQVISVNTNGVLYTAQAAGRQMARFGNGGSIILIASMSGSITNRVRTLGGEWRVPVGSSG